MASWLMAATLAALLGAAPSGGAQDDLVPPAAAPQDRVTPIALTTSGDEARWRTPLCAGVTGLSAEHAQYVVDRVSQRAAEFGVRAAAPGCAPNLLIVFSADPSGQARAIARERTDPASVTGVSGQTAGLSAYNNFVASNAPVRWWRVVQPLSDRGEVVSRDERAGEPARVNVEERGRLRPTVRDAFSHVIVIVDLGQVNGVSLGALSDYLAMVALAPAEPNGQEADSILNYFSARAAGQSPPDQLSAGDIAYLRQVYR